MIKFGTSGWRAIIADEFTYANVQRAVAGISRYVAAHAAGRPPRLIIGYDPRFLGPQFAEFSAQNASSHGIHVLLCQEPAPTPAIAFQVRAMKTDGAINFTASHNPPEYQGIKFSTPDGAPALPEVTQEIERLIEEGGRGSTGGGQIQPVDLRPAYLEDLARKVDLEAIRKAELKMVYDPLFGAGRGYLDGLLRSHGIPIVTIHDRQDVLFGGHAPEPADEHLHDLQQAMQEHGAVLGLATDGDADRFGVVDAGGHFISPNYLIALLFDYLLESRDWADVGAAKSVATTNLINAVAAHFGRPLYETPVGFKYIGELIKQDKVAIGGEESAGLSIRHHVPEKDGILACLLAAEMVARRGASLRAQLDTLFAKVGAFYPVRLNLRLPEDAKVKFKERLKSDPASFAGRRVHEVVRTDGLKLVLEDGSWVLFRLSGTEPVCRVYVEARREQDVALLIEEGKRFAFGS
jgi:phosphoglucomutase